MRARRNENRKHVTAVEQPIVGEHLSKVMNKLMCCDVFVVIDDDDEFPRYFHCAPRTL